MKLKQDFFEQLTGYYQQVMPTPLPAPHWLLWSDEAAKLVGIDQPNDHWLQVFSGNQRLPQAQYYAQVYSGHQFGGYSPRLGDGRSIILGEAVGAQGSWDVALKGAGPTPFSRHGDGRAVTRSAVREFLISEALAALNIPTTRALAVIGSDLPVWRETLEKGAITVRLARSHIRFGHFEYFYYGDEHRSEKVQRLADFVIQQHFPQFSCDNAGYKAWFAEVVASTARLIAKWQVFGFAHGVMNTDNMSILGDSFDFGPFSFLDTYQEDFICNHSDPEGRYAFSQQPGIGLWNLQCLAQALTPIISSDDLLAALRQYQPTLVQHYLQLMGARLGFAVPAEQTEAEQQQDLQLIGEFTQLLEQQKLDYTNTLRQFAHVSPDGNSAALRDEFVDVVKFDGWWQQYQQRVSKVSELDAWQQARRLANPKYILRNYQAQQATEQALAGDLSGLQTLHQLLKNPFDEQPALAHYADRPPQWGEGLIMSCSS
ncbi:YdiU family protein [Shewanella avicenniae]|uniref:Protein nucleotidyltransferase YdiU n=1 Tax=Shewanella avicenniae TaxID=2814294 RepID=A0ABX7QR22_9GAMM|nr:YdiU family protein [Shewanella avicenniae]QSX33386.1 YdiU family protein [Shewanella avicenniae]